MADAILSADRLRAVVEYDPETGVFIRKVRLAQRHQAGDRADFRINKGPMTGYRRLSLDSKRFLAHRCAWLYVHSEWPQGEIDHINGDPGDNRIENLRVVETQTNAENKRRPRKDNRSGFLGVQFHRQNKNWVAKIQHNRKTIHIGSFATPEMAHEAYLSAKRKIHAGCTI